jgi:glycosyltransferase involved in cell wall biosynthesis
MMRGNGPLVSIVIPSFNHARYLKSAIESALDQDYPHIELIVIDDGSTDESAAVLEKFRGRCHVEIQDNRGQAATMNRGWRMSRGAILAYLSADDLLYPRAASAAVQALEAQPDTVVTYCDFDLIDPSSAVVRRVRVPEFDYQAMVTEMICPPGPGAFFRRAAFDQAGDWDGRYRQFGDYEFWLRLARYGGFVRLPETLAAFRVHPQSQSFTPSPGFRPEEPVELMQAFLATAPVASSARAKALSTAHLLSARLNLRAGRYREGAAAARRAFALYPRHVFALRTLRLAFNAVFNRLGHRVLWSLRAVLRKSQDASPRGRS